MAKSNVIDLVEGGTCELDVRGRGKPTATIRVNADGTASVRVEFDDYPELWADLDLPTCVGSAQMALVQGGREELELAGPTE